MRIRTFLRVLKNNFPDGGILIAAAVILIVAYTMNPKRKAKKSGAKKHEEQ